MQLALQQPASVRNRKLHPSCDIHGNIQISKRTATKRRCETYEMVKKIHGCTNENSLPALRGLLDTLSVKFKKADLVSEISKQDKLCNKVFPLIYNEKVASFEESEINIVRSKVIYFTKGVMGKAKYKSVYKTLCMTKAEKKGNLLQRLKIASCNVPRLLPYNKLMPHIKSIDFGKVEDVRTGLCDGLEEEEKCDGCFRSLEPFLQLLASFYFSLEKEGKISLLWFNEPNTFQVLLGGDGAPFGKDSSACCWLLSFLNRGKKILSSNENFLIFGANCSEDSPPVLRFVKRLQSEMVCIENKVYFILGREVKFRFAELPNDLKMLALLAGELPVSAKFFSTFANVSTDDCDDPNGTFWIEDSNKWEPWSYASRLKMSKRVENLKQKVNKQNISDKTKRKKITEFISSSKSRQEFQPLIGSFINRAHVDPLHSKNNACQQLFQLIIEESIGKSSISANVTTFNAVPVKSAFFKLVFALKEQAKMVRLVKKIKKWFDDNNEPKRFRYRFTGLESRLFLKNFMFLIDALKQPHDSARQTFWLHIFLYTCV